MDSIEQDLGTLVFLVPNVVLNELEKLRNISKKKSDIEQTLEFIQKFKKIPINGTYADKEILHYIKSKKTFVGTMDKDLKKNIKFLGSNIISFHNNYIILEN